jgi:hypothetical protein
MWRGYQRRYDFFTIAVFADIIVMTPRQVRHYITECGMPAHGEPHKGTSLLRLSESSLTWYREIYQPMTRFGRRQFRRSNVNESHLGDIFCVYSDEQHAYAKLYNQPDVEDPFLLDPENADEVRRWKRFREINPKTGKTLKSVA